ncbi:MAG TPA: glucose-6-phosphate isomerase [Caulobacterales bacterium]|nr:glucose-6-phosphate isomerase [Caulobacterales bacterium]
MDATEITLRDTANARLQSEAARLSKTRLTELFAANPARVEKLSLSAPHLFADFSKQRIDGAALDALSALAGAANWEAWRARMFAGDIVNSTEQRAVMHWALRDPEGPPEVLAVRDRMHDFGHEIGEAGEIHAVVHLGIGGSDLGPRLLIDALKPHRRKHIEVRFAANVDGADVVDAIDGLDPKRTLLVVVSKTFTTQETLANAAYVRNWGPAIITAATAAPEKAVAWGVKPEHVFPFWDWVGGRYSLWSSVSLVAEIALEHGVFNDLLDGAAEMDAHFRSAPFTENLPALAAAIQHWNRQALGHSSYAMIPYSERLRLLPAYLQQLEMESNGKGVNREGKPLAQSSAVVTWGAAGTNAQHSFFQLLHQGVDEIPVEFVVNEGDHEGPADHRAKLLANALAQTRALMVGKSTEAVYEEMIKKGASAEEAARLAPHRTFRGDRASTMIGMDALSPAALGALLAFYEHRTFTQGVLAGINSFDQWGVELGKEMANQLAPALESGKVPEGMDASTAAWIKRLAR